MIFSLLIVSIIRVLIFSALFTLFIFLYIFLASGMNKSALSLAISYSLSALQLFAAIAAPLAILVAVLNRKPEVRKTKR